MPRTQEEKRGLRRQKMSKMGPTKVKMKAMQTLKTFLIREYKKVPRAYESLIPAMITTYLVLCVLGILTSLFWYGG